MRTILVQGREYRQLGSTALYEAEFEAVIESAAGDLFPGFVLVPFKVPVSSAEGTRRPDMALVDKEYRRWIVVEAELAHHSLESHVLPQVEVLINGDYGPEHADALADASPELSRRRARSMMMGEPPSVLVIVNDCAPDWAAALTKLGASLAVVRVFRSNSNQHALLVEMDRPALPSSLVSMCRRSPVLASFWEVLSPAALPATKHLTLMLDGKATDWQLVQAGDTVWIRPTRGDPLAGVNRVALRRDSDDVLAIDVVPD